MTNLCLQALAVLLISVLFGCGGQEATFTSDSQYATNNNGVGDYGTGGGAYTCISGQKLKIYLDPTDTGQISAQNYLGEVVSYSGNQSSIDNYNYYSASAHPVIGPTPLGFEANIFFYQGTDGLSLNFFANVDEGGSTDNLFDVNISTDAKDTDANVLLSDDSMELKETSTNNFQGRFHYWSNTDGGVIGPFDPNEKFSIGFQFTGTGDVSAARFFSANGFSFALADTSRDISSFIITNEDFETCSQN